MKHNSDSKIMKFAAELITLIKGSGSKETALKAVADRSMELFSGQTPDFASSANFRKLTYYLTELLEQIIFEVNENYPADYGVRDSVFDNLLSRITLFCEALSDIDHYKSHLTSRKLYFEDTVIISSFGLSEFNDYLVNCFNDSSDLQKVIIKTLLKTRTGNETGFLYSTAAGSFCYELRILSLLALKLNSDNAIQWNGIKAENISFKQALDYIRKAEMPPELEANLDNIFITLFELYFAEHNADHYNNEKLLGTVLRYLLSALNSDKNNSIYGDIITAVTAIILFFTDHQIKLIINNSHLLKILIDILDNLPQDSAVCASRRLNRFHDEIADSINGLFNCGRINFNDNASNAIKYISLNM